MWPLWNITKRSAAVVLPWIYSALHYAHTHFSFIASLLESATVVFHGIAEIFPFIVLSHEIIHGFHHQNRFSPSSLQRGGPSITQCSVLCLRKQALLHECAMRMFLQSRVPTGNMSCMRTNKSESQQPEPRATTFYTLKVMAPAAACSWYVGASVQEKHSNPVNSWRGRRIV